MSSHSQTEGERALSRHLQTGPFFKALLISILVEFAVLFLTGASVLSSMMHHGGAAPRSIWEDLMANIGIFFHLPSILIVMPFGLFILAPLVQIGLMTCALGLILRARRNRRRPPLPFLT